VTARFLPGNRVQLLETGGEYFPALLEAIAAAREEVRLESYIFANDSTGHQIAAALADAAQRGVRVHVLVDGFGSRGFMQSLGGELIAAGVEVLIFGPEVSPFTLRRHRLRRLHRKLACVDARIAFVGGINIIDDFDRADRLPPRYDYAVRLEGPLLAPIHDTMRHLWALVRWTKLGRRPSKSPHPVLGDGACGDVSAAFLVRDNLRHRRDIESAYLKAINAAKEEILLANAYFLPGRRFRHALMAAARRGVKVSVLLQGRVEYLLLHYASHALYGALLASGVRIFEYQQSFLHAKVAAIDGVWATVGSSNIDPFSLLLAREANVVVRNRGFARLLSISLQRAATQGAIEVDRENWGRKPPWLRAAHWIAYGLVRLLIGLAGYGNSR